MRKKLKSLSSTFGQLAHLTSLAMEYYLFKGNNPVIDENFILFIFKLFINKGKKNKIFVSNFSLLIFFLFR